MCHRANSARHVDHVQDATSIARYSIALFWSNTSNMGNPDKLDMSQVLGRVLSRSLEGWESTSGAGSTTLEGYEDNCIILGDGYRAGVLGLYTKWGTWRK